MFLAGKATKYRENKPIECPIRKHRFAGEIHRYHEILPTITFSLAKTADENETANIGNSCRKFIERNATYSTAFNSLSDQDKTGVLDCLSGGKGAIPYKLIKSHENLDTTPEGEFFSRTKFYSSLKNEIISDEEYKNVNKFWQILRLQKLSNLNDIYNFQDTFILCEIFKNRVKEMTKKLPYNPRKCTSASSLSGCIH